MLGEIMKNFQSARRGRKNLLVFVLLLWAVIVSSPSYTQVSAEDQYRQIGGLAGLVDLCFQTRELESVVFKRVGNVFYSNPELGRQMVNLLTLYFAFYDEAQSKQLMWNTTSQSYNRVPWTCSDEDKVTIKAMEDLAVKAWK